MIRPVVRVGVVIAAGLAVGMVAGKTARSRISGVDISGRVEAAAGAAAGGMAVGPGTGVPVLRVFGDYECPACAALERQAGDTLRALARRGHIRFVYHHSPLRMHVRGKAAARAAYCAPGPKRWIIHAELYDSAPFWRTGGDTVEQMLSVLAPVADTGLIRACLGSDTVHRRVAADRALADGLGVIEVPTIFWGDRRLRVRTWSALVRFVAGAAP